MLRSPTRMVGVDVGRALDPSERIGRDERIASQPRVARGGIEENDVRQRGKPFESGDRGHAAGQRFDEGQGRGGQTAHGAPLASSGDSFGFAFAEGRLR